MSGVSREQGNPRKITVPSDNSIGCCPLGTLGFAKCVQVPAKLRRGARDARQAINRSTTGKGRKVWEVQRRTRVVMELDIGAMY